MNNSIQNKTISIFESIKHIDKYGNEYWYARELQKVLEYKQWRRFKETIQKAIDACKRSKFNVSEHFANVGKLSKRNNNAIVKIEDYKLSRYACYLIAQNGDSRKELIALAQTYFAIQTRKQELFDIYSEDKRRIDLRKKVKEGNYGLNRTALNSGVKNLGEFHNAGYKGLYNGETAADIFKRKKLKYREDILDNMGSVELGANLFRITQTNDKLKRNQIDNEYTANSVHYEIGKKVRNAIKDMNGIMPEDLPTPKSNTKELEKDNKKITNMD